MGFLSKPIKNLDDLFVHTLQDIYYAELQIIKALPKMIEKVGDSQVKRVEQVFMMHEVPVHADGCPAIDGILDEANAILGDAKDTEVLDAAALAAAQAVEHYEISRYGTLIAWARQLGRNDCASVLEQNLKEEKAADQTLTANAEARVNRVAV